MPWVIAQQTHAEAFENINAGRVNPMLFLPRKGREADKAPWGSSLGLLGHVILFGIDLRGGYQALLGGLLVLAAAVCYAAGALMIRRHLADAEPLGVAAAAMLVTTVHFLLPGACSHSS
ncbi:hypothetical protein ACWEPL_59495 [Nonomuraea sp. NPDC004186]